jgi:Response regulator containing CheY-like receiver domain and AraC-type DNA-binding domain
MNMTKKIILLLTGLSVLFPLAAQKMKPALQPKTSCPTVKIEAERLPGLNIPRSGHSAFVVNGEVTIVGGHTSGFKLTPTAEYFEGGEWHLLQTVYPHDGGFALVLKSGKVLVAGGFKDNLGIGQSFEVEMYDPTAHRFDGFGCLNQKRASATAIELDSGQVMITGNWYTSDEIELFDGEETFSHLKAVSQPRCLPHLFRTSDGDVLVVAGYDTKGQPIDTAMVERMKGGAFSAPLLETWHPLIYDYPLHGDEGFIGDEEKGIFAYLMPVRDKTGQVAIAEVHDTVFSLLPTDYPVPMDSQWGKIFYYTPVYADRQQQRGYVIGCDSTGRQYTLCLDYTKTPAQLTLYHTDPLTESFTLTIPVMMDDGNLMLTGIKPAIKYNFNFTPTASVWLLRFNDNTSTISADSTSSWLWKGLTLAFIIMIAIGIALQRKKRVNKNLPKAEQPSEPVTEPTEESENESIAGIDDELIERIIHLVKEKKMYLNSDLTTSDIANELRLHRNYVSACINSQIGTNFNQLVNNYRIEHAKQLMQQQPDMKLSSVAIESGFSNETSFYRAFKAITGKTPSEWKAIID